MILGNMAMPKARSTSHDVDLRQLGFLSVRIPWQTWQTERSVFTLPISRVLWYTCTHKDLSLVLAGSWRTRSNHLHPTIAGHCNHYLAVTEARQDPNFCYTRHVQSCTPDSSSESLPRTLEPPCSYHCGSPQPLSGCDECASRVRLPWQSSSPILYS